MSQPSDTFTIGIIQDHATADAQANVARAERLVREAARRGAQIICLKELFNAPYFCKSQQAERFDLAEPIPGPTTDAMAGLCGQLKSDWYFCEARDPQAKGAVGRDQRHLGGLTAGVGRDRNEPIITTS